MWLFENSLPELVAPAKYFIDFLGEGLSGAIYGKRTVINTIRIGKYELKKPTVSFPDSSATAYARKFTSRNGSLGGGILKRFTVIFNYQKTR